MAKLYGTKSGFQERFKYVQGCALKQQIPLSQATISKEDYLEVLFSTNVTLPADNFLFIMVNSLPL